MYDSVFLVAFLTILGLKGLEIRFSNVLKPFSDDLNLVEGGRKQMKQWLLQLKELEDVQISGIKVSLDENIFIFADLRFIFLYIIG